MALNIFEPLLFKFQTFPIYMVFHQLMLFTNNIILGTSKCSNMKLVLIEIETANIFNAVVLSPHCNTTMNASTFHVKCSLY